MNMRHQGGIKLVARFKATSVIVRRCVGSMIEMVAKPTKTVVSLTTL